MLTSVLLEKHTGRSVFRDLRMGGGEALGQPVPYTVQRTLGVDWDFFFIVSFKTRLQSPVYTLLLPALGGSQISAEFQGQPGLHNKFQETNKQQTNKK